MHNKAIRALGIEELQSFTARLQAPIVSVGSGTGATERVLFEIDQDLEAGTDYICVDPEPTSYQQGDIVVEPHFATVSQLLERRPELEKHCDLFLNWPAPNDNLVDWAAILLLKPRRIVLVLGTDGASGGFALLNGLEAMNYNWAANLSDTTADFGWVEKTPHVDINYLQDNYEVAAVSTCQSGSSHCGTIFRYILLRRKDVAVSKGVESLNNYKYRDRQEGECRMF